MAAARKLGFVLTPDEYLDQERNAPTKSEFLSGTMLAMAGGSPIHSAICTDTRTTLQNHLRARGSDCDVFDSDLKVRITSTGPFFYPDASIVCGNPLFDSDDCLLNPIIIIEVLSNSTAGYDRGEKFFHYRRLSSLRHYVLIEQDRVLIEHFALNSEGFWALLGEHTERTDVLTFDDLNLSLPLSEIYRRLSL